jgi:AAT family amino acid transporter/GABA permease
LSPSGTPRRAILLAAFLAFAIALVGLLSPYAVFDFLVSATGTLVLADYVLIIVAQIRLRRVAEASGERFSVRMWGFPYISGASLLFLLGVIVIMALDPTTRREVVLGSCTLCFVIACEWTRTLWLRFRQGSPAGIG